MAAALGDVTDQVLPLFVSPASSVFLAELAVSSVYNEMAYVLRLWVKRLKKTQVVAPESNCLAFLFRSENGIMLTNSYGVWACQRKTIQSEEMIVFGLEE